MMVVNIIIQAQNWKFYRMVELEGLEIYKTQHNSGQKIDRGMFYGHDNLKITRSCPITTEERTTQTDTLWQNSEI